MTVHETHETLLEREAEARAIPVAASGCAAHESRTAGLAIAVIMAWDRYQLMQWGWGCSSHSAQFGAHASPYRETLLTKHKVVRK